MRKWFVIKIEQALTFPREGLLKGSELVLSAAYYPCRTMKRRIRSSAFSMFS